MIKDDKVSFETKAETLVSNQRLNINKNIYLYTQSNFTTGNLNQ